MALKWKKLGVRTWGGESGVHHYTIDRSLDDGRYHVVRGSIFCGERWASAGSLQGAKDAAEIDTAKITCPSCEGLGIDRLDNSRCNYCEGRGRVR
jgi:hypothetical protein